MKTIKVFLLNVMLIISLGVSAQDYTYNDKVICISQIWKDASSKFHSPQQLRTIKWDSLYVSCLKKAISTQSDSEFYLVMRELIAKLNDGHSNINYDNYMINKQKLDYIAADIKYINKNYYILGIEQSLSDVIPLGSKIIELNNIPIQKYLDLYVMQYAFGQTLQDRIKSALQFVSSSSKLNDSIALKIVTPKGVVKNTFLRYDALKKKIKKKSMAATKFSSVNYCQSTCTYLAKDSKKRDYYYLRIDNFTQKYLVGMIRKEANNIQKSKYIVLDLRHNIGGSELEADSLLMCFLNVDTLITYKSSTRKDNAFYSAMGYGFPKYKEYYDDLAMDTLPADTLERKDLPLFSQPLFILIGEDTYSAAEDLLITLKLHFPKRAILVGTPTGGSTGAPLVRRLPYHNSYYRICTRKPSLPSGMFENGIQPEFFYEMSVEDHLKGTDRIFNLVESIYK